MERNEIIQQAKRIVVKVGSSILTTSSGYLAPEKVKSVVDAVSRLEKDFNKQVVLVSSGAIACGMDLLGLKKKTARACDITGRCCSWSGTSYAYI